MKPINVFRFNAESQVDVARFLLAIAEKGVFCSITDWEPSLLTPNVTITVHTHLTLPELSDTLNSIPDGHVMAETLAVVSIFDKERNERGVQAKAD